MTQHTDFSTRLDDLQQRVATARSAVQAAATESDAQLRQRIDRAQADLDQSVENARQQVSQAADSARAKWAQTEGRRRRQDGRRQGEHRQADTARWTPRSPPHDADWAEADAAEALDFADWAVENAELVDARRHPRPRLRRQAREGRSQLVVPASGLVHEGPALDTAFAPRQARSG